jgi:hypothetical protein
VGALIGGGDVMPEDGNGVLLLLMLPVLIFISLAWHEAGHLLAGRLVGMRPTLFIVGPLQIRWSDDDASVGVNRMAALYGGLAAAAPRTTQRLRQRMMVLVVGGPAATILLVLLANGVGGALRDTAPNAALLLLTTGFLNVFIALFTLVPLPAQGFMTDGSQLILYARGGVPAQLRLRIVALHAELLGGTRPRDLDPALIEEAVALSAEGDPLSRISALLYAYYHALDRDDPARAGAHLERALAERHAYPNGFRQGLDLEAAFYYAWYGEDPEQAAAWLAEGTGGVVESHTRARAEAAVAWARGDVSRAQQLARDGLAAVDRSVDRGTAQAEAEWLREVANRPVPEQTRTDH